MHRVNGKFTWVWLEWWSMERSSQSWAPNRGFLEDIQSLIQLLISQSDLGVFPNRPTGNRKMWSFQKPVGGSVCIWGLKWDSAGAVKQHRRRVSQSLREQWRVWESSGLVRGPPNCQLSQPVGDRPWWADLGVHRVERKQTLYVERPPKNKSGAPGWLSG